MMINKVCIYPATFERKIGFDAVRVSVAKHCSSPRSAELVCEMSFSNDYDIVRRRLIETNEMLNALAITEPIPLSEVEDTQAIIVAVKVPGTHIETSGLAILRRQLTDVSSIFRFFARHNETETFPVLNDVAGPLDDLPDVVHIINRILTREGEIKDNASPELAEIRRQQATISGRISSAMRRVLANGVRDGVLDADASPSIRDGRLVIPVAPMHKRSISGIVHDESASGKTLFIEPAEVVELNNRRRELEMAERREIIRILTEVTDAIRPFGDTIIANNTTLTYFDFLRAKARYASETGACMPHLSKCPELEMYTARHPVLEANLQRQERRIIPLDIVLNRENHLLIISGPNAGGKSVALKTTGIIQYMMQCGLLPTVAENSHLGIFDRIFADIGDDQSIEDDLSTYSSHLRNMKFFLSNGNDRTLILIDEFGSGTEPQIGGAIAQALLTDFNVQGLWGVITTHYQNLKTMAENTPGLINGSMLYDRGKMQPLFKLSIGYPGSSFAIEIARKIGLPEDIIKQASDIVGSDYVNLDKYLLDIARDRRYWENKRDKIKRREKHLEEVIENYSKDAENLRANRRAIIEDARRQADEIIAGSNASIERTIHDIRRAQAEKEATVKARRQLTECRETLHSENNDIDHPLLAKAPKSRKKKIVEPRESLAKEKPVIIGSTVLLDKQGRPGTVLEIDASGKKATVAFGTMKISVPVSRLSHTMRKDSSSVSKASSFVSTATAEAMRTRQLNFKPEIDVRGMRADEALQAVTYFIDDALQFGVTRVRILHGTGTGALRVAIRQYLSSVNGVRSARDEDVRFGGAGITVVEM